jgi:flagellin-specific chaperone FliS
MTYSDNVRKYKQNELALASPEEGYLKCFDFVVNNLKRAAIALEKKDNIVFYNLIGPAYKMWGILVDAFGSAPDTNEKGVKDLEVIYASVERKIGQILRNKDYETLKRIIGIIENIRDMWLKLLESAGGAGER